MERHPVGNIPTRQMDIESLPVMFPELKSQEEQKPTIK